MINLTDPPAAPAVRVDWIWTVSVERVLEKPAGPAQLGELTSCS